MTTTNSTHEKYSGNISYYWRNSRTKELILCSEATTWAQALESWRYLVTLRHYLRTNLFTLASLDPETLSIMPAMDFRPGLQDVIPDTLELARRTFAQNHAGIHEILEDIGKFAPLMGLPDAEGYREGRNFFSHGFLYPGQRKYGWMMKHVGGVQRLYEELLEHVAVNLELLERDMADEENWVSPEEVEMRKMAEINLWGDEDTFVGGGQVEWSCSSGDEWVVDDSWGEADTLQESGSEVEKGEEEEDSDDEEEADVPLPEQEDVTTTTDVASQSDSSSPKFTLDVFQAIVVRETPAQAPKRGAPRRTLHLVRRAREYTVNIPHRFSRYIRQSRVAS